MFKLKPISTASISEALEKAERYRFLNEPRLAESICLDILEAEPGNHKAKITMILAITDQFARAGSPDSSQAKNLIPQLNSDYEKFYYSGIICERLGKAALSKEAMGSHFLAYERLKEAMDFYEKAEKVRPPGNDDSILRWNTCARLIMKNNLKPRTEEYSEPPLE